jgi:hypothetical protein
MMRVIISRKVRGVGGASEIAIHTEFWWGNLK